MAYFRCGMGGGKKYDDYKGKTVTAKAVSSDDTNTYLTIPKEGIYDETSKICTPNSNLGNKTVLSNLSRQTTGSNNLKSVFNISNLYSKYKSISIDDIFIKIKSFKVSGVSDFTWSFSYDPSTGLITVDSGQRGLLCYPTNIDVFITK